MISFLRKKVDGYNGTTFPLTTESTPSTFAVLSSPLLSRCSWRVACLDPIGPDVQFSHT